MREKFLTAQLYAHTAAQRTKEIAADVKENVTENKAQYAKLAAATIVVTTIANVQGFKKGYKFAKNPPHIAV